MLHGLKQFTLNMIAGANVASVVVMLLVGYADCLSPERHPMLSNLGLLFPLFLVVNVGFLVFWILFRLRYVVIPFLGFVVCYAPVRKFCPINLPHETPDGSIKVLSYNILNYTPLEPETMGEGDINPVIAYIQEQDADIVCLQEAQPHPGVSEQIDSLLKPVYAYRDTTLHSPAGDCLALFSKYPIKGKKRIHYASKGNLSVAYRLLIDNEEVIVVNNHLETTGLSLDERRQFKNLIKGQLETDTARQTSKLLVVKLAEATRKRAPQADAVADYIRRHSRESIIVCGDFNDGPISYAHRTIARGLTDCYVATGRGPGISYHKSGFFVRIDNIMCTPDWTPYDCRVDSKIGASDHYPILCNLKKTPKTPKKE